MTPVPFRPPPAIASSRGVGEPGTGAKVADDPAMLFHHHNIARLSPEHARQGDVMMDFNERTESW